MSIIRVRGLESYSEQTGEGLPLVFIHGAFADARLWEPQWEFFSSRFRLLRYDLRGHGRTGVSNLDRYTISTFADDLVALLQALEIELPVICGLSMGGVIAQALAASYPAVPRALILASAPVSASLTLGEKLLRYVLMPRWAALSAIRALGARRFTRFSLWLARRLWGQHWLGANPKAQDYVEQCMLAMDENEFLKVWGAIYSFDRFALERITCPTLVLNGEHEAKGSFAHTTEILRRIPFARAEVIPAASHAMSLENPAAFNRAVAEFLSSLGRAG